jgi:hypothetical protein
MVDVLLSEDKCSSRYHRCEWKNGPYESTCIMILLISYDMIVVENICLWKIVVCYCGGCDPMVVTVCHWLVAMCY